LGSEWWKWEGNAINQYSPSVSADVDQLQYKALHAGLVILARGRRVPSHNIPVTPLGVGYSYIDLLVYICLAQVFRGI